MPLVRNDPEAPLWQLQPMPQLQDMSVFQIRPITPMYAALLRNPPKLQCMSNMNLGNSNGTDTDKQLYNKYRYAGRKAMNSTSQKLCEVFRIQNGNLNVIEKEHQNPNGNEKFGLEEKAENRTSVSSLGFDNKDKSRAFQEKGIIDQNGNIITEILADSNNIQTQKWTFGNVVCESGVLSGESVDMCAPVRVYTSSLDINANIAVPCDTGGIQEGNLASATKTRKSKGNNTVDHQRCEILNVSPIPRDQCPAEEWKLDQGPMYGSSIDRTSSRSSHNGDKKMREEESSFNQTTPREETKTFSQYYNISKSGNSIEHDTEKMLNCINTGEKATPLVTQADSRQGNIMKAEDMLSEDKTLEGDHVLLGSVQEEGFCCCKDQTDILIKSRDLYPLRCLSCKGSTPCKCERKDLSKLLSPDTNHQRYQNGNSKSFLCESCGLLIIADPPAVTGTCDPPAGITDPPVGIGDPPAGISDSPVGIGDPPAGITDPPVGIGDPPAGITDPPVGIGDPPSATGIGDPPTATEIGDPPTATEIGGPTAGIGDPPTAGIGDPTEGLHDEEELPKTVEGYPRKSIINEHHTLEQIPITSRPFQEIDSSFSEPFRLNSDQFVSETQVLHPYFELVKPQTGSGLFTTSTLDDGKSTPTKLQRLDQYPNSDLPDVISKSKKPLTPGGKAYFFATKSAEDKSTLYKLPTADTPYKHLRPDEKGTAFVLRLFDGKSTSFRLLLPDKDGTSFRLLPPARTVSSSCKLAKHDEKCVTFVLQLCDGKPTYSQLLTRDDKGTSFVVKLSDGASSSYNLLKPDEKGPFFILLSLDERCTAYKLPLVPISSRPQLIAEEQDMFIYSDTQRLHKEKYASPKQQMCDGKIISPNQRIVERTHTDSKAQSIDNVKSTSPKAQRPSPFSAAQLKLNTEDEEQIEHHLKMEFFGMQQLYGTALHEENFEVTRLFPGSDTSEEGNANQVAEMTTKPGQSSYSNCDQIPVKNQNRTVDKKLKRPAAKLLTSTKTKASAGESFVFHMKPMDHNLVRLSRIGARKGPKSRASHVSRNNGKKKSRSLSRSNSQKDGPSSMKSVLGFSNRTPNMLGLSKFMKLGEDALCDVSHSVLDKNVGDKILDIVPKANSNCDTQREKEFPPRRFSDSITDSGSSMVMTSRQITHTLNKVKGSIPGSSIVKETRGSDQCSSRVTELGSVQEVKWSVPGLSVTKEKGSDPGSSRVEEPRSFQEITNGSVPGSSMIEEMRGSDPGSSHVEEPRSFKEVSNDSATGSSLIKKMRRSNPGSSLIAEQTSLREVKGSVPESSLIEEMQESVPFSSRVAEPRSDPTPILDGDSRGCDTRQINIKESRGSSMVEEPKGSDSRRFITGEFGGSDLGSVIVMEPRGSNPAPSLFKELLGSGTGPSIVGETSRSDSGQIINRDISFPDSEQSIEREPKGPDSGISIGGDSRRSGTGPSLNRDIRQSIERTPKGSDFGTSVGGDSRRLGTGPSLNRDIRQSIERTPKGSDFGTSVGVDSRRLGTGPSLNRDIRQSIERAPKGYDSGTSVGGDSRRSGTGLSLNREIRQSIERAAKGADSGTSVGGDSRKSDTGPSLNREIRQSIERVLKGSDSGTSIGGDSRKSDTGPSLNREISESGSASKVAWESNRSNTRPDICDVMESSDPGPSIVGESNGSEADQDLFIGGYTEETMPLSQQAKSSLDKGIEESINLQTKYPYIYSVLEDQGHNNSLQSSTKEDSLNLHTHNSSTAQDLQTAIDTRNQNCDSDTSVINKICTPMDVSTEENQHASHCKNSVNAIPSEIERRKTYSFDFFCSIVLQDKRVLKAQVQKLCKIVSYLDDAYLRKNRQDLFDVRNLHTCRGPRHYKRAPRFTYIGQKIVRPKLRIIKILKKKLQPALIRKLKERLKTQRREKECVETPRRKKEGLETPRRKKECIETPRRKKECIETPRRKKEGLETHGRKKTTTVDKKHIPQRKQLHKTVSPLNGKWQPVSFLNGKGQLAKATLKSAFGLVNMVQRRIKAQRKQNKSDENITSFVPPITASQVFETFQKVKTSNMAEKVSECHSTKISEKLGDELPSKEYQQCVENVGVKQQLSRVESLEVKENEMRAERSEVEGQETIIGESECNGETIVDSGSVTVDRLERIQKGQSLMMMEEDEDVEYRGEVGTIDGHDETCSGDKFPDSSLLLSSPRVSTINGKENQIMTSTEQMLVDLEEKSDEEGHQRFIDSTVDISQNIQNIPNSDWPCDEKCHEVLNSSMQHTQSSNNLSTSVTSGVLDNMSPSGASYSNIGAEEIESSNDIYPKEIDPADDICPKEIDPADDICPKEIDPADDNCPKEIDPADDICPKEIDPAVDSYSTSKSGIQENEISSYWDMMFDSLFTEFKNAFDINCNEFKQNVDQLQDVRGASAHAEKSALCTNTTTERIGSTTERIGLDCSPQEPSGDVKEILCENRSCIESIQQHVCNESFWGCGSHSGQVDILFTPHTSKNVVNYSDKVRNQETGFSVDTRKPDQSFMQQMLELVDNAMCKNTDGARPSAVCDQDMTVSSTCGTVDSLLDVQDVKTLAVDKVPVCLYSDISDDDVDLRAIEEGSISDPEDPEYMEDLPYIQHSVPLY